MVHQKIEELRFVLEGKKQFDDLSFNQILVELYPHINSDFFKSQMNSLRNQIEVIRDNSTMQGRAFAKVHGYAGDFEIIDKIYTKHISEKPNCKKWDEYFHNQTAPIAVRNRKRYFKQKFKKLNKSSFQNVLNLASGSCRDIVELFSENPNSNFKFECVELDSKAIRYATTLLGNKIDKVHFINKNIFRFHPETKYDIIWSAGLFDYFDDKTFEKILKRLIESNPKSKIIIGNFSDENPTAPYMEIIGEWFLNHRSPEKLIQIAVNAGADPNAIEIESEPEKVNLFLNIN